MKTGSSTTFRPPAVPLVTVDPYTSCWSMADHLYDDWPRHWTEVPHSMCGMARVDGQVFCFLGRAAAHRQTAQQLTLEVHPTQSIYTFACGPVELRFTFTSPLLLDDLERLSRPVSYLTLDLRATDDRAHEVQLYFDVSGEWAVDKPYQEVEWGHLAHDDLDVLYVRSVEQNVLGKQGDDLRIDWGTLYLALPRGTAQVAAGEAADVRARFAAAGCLPAADWQEMPHPANCWGGVVLAAAISEPAVGRETRSAHLILAYDDEYAVEYFHTPLRAWWRREADASPERLLADSEREYDDVMARCRAFDAELMARAEAAGGEQYARLVSLAYRQAIAAHKLVCGPEGELFWFSKENNSNGCMGTVDVTYPSTPLFLLYNPELVKGMLTPILQFCRSEQWAFPFAAHDVGRYPKANGQVYGYGRLELQMPVEESGNVLILCAAIARLEGNADYARQHWDLLTKWAQYLRDKGLDPENQLCTDDFAGHLAHNANLSIKAIVALACYGRLAEMLGHEQAAAEYTALARRFAAEWERMAEDGDHYRLTFDRPGTWSLKYNLVWDRLLDLGLFAPHVARREIAYYLRVQNDYGVPLDCRRPYTKSDWVLWCAAMAERDEDFRSLVAPIYRYAHETPSRVPLSDWHDTVTGRHIGMKARSVVGGYFMKLLADALAADAAQD
jgi:hypothetical protein